MCNITLAARATGTCGRQLWMHITTTAWTRCLSLPASCRSPSSRTTSPWSRTSAASAPLWGSAHMLCICVCMYVYVYILHTSIYDPTHEYMCVCIYIGMHMNIRKHICTYTCICIYMYTCMYLFMHECIYTINLFIHKCMCHYINNVMMTYPHVCIYIYV